MTERENNVYKAKLAEQAERYDGEYEKNGARKKNFFFLSAERQLLGRGPVPCSSRGLRYVENCSKCPQIYTAGEKRKEKKK